MTVLDVQRRDGIVTVTLDEPRKRNALDSAGFDLLAALWREVAARADDRVVILTGSGGSFCAGADLGDPEAAEATQGAGKALSQMRRVADAAVALHALPKPTVAVVDGPAVGAGCNLALGCDLVLASERATFRQAFSSLGLVVDSGGSWILPRLVGLARAKELLLLGELVDATEAERIGLVNRVLPVDEVMGEARQLAERLAALPPVSLGLLKPLLNRSLSSSFADAVEQEGVAQAVALRSGDSAEAMAAFVEKRPPRFTGA